MKNNNLVVVDEHLIGTQIGLYHGHLKHDTKLVYCLFINADKKQTEYNQR
jgi:hypothetical protein